MFSYLKSIKGFLDDCSGVEEECSKKCNSKDCKCKLVAYLEKSVSRSNYGYKKSVDASEIRAWCNSVAFYFKSVMEELVNDNENYNNLVVGLEYYLETRECFVDDKIPHVRVDVMLGGYKNDEMRIMLIELKQYDKVVSISNDRNTINWEYEYNLKNYLQEGPNSQVLEYCLNISKSINNSGNQSILFIPCVYMHNLHNLPDVLSSGNIHGNIHKKDGYIIDDRVCYKNEPIRVYLKKNDNNNGIVNYIKENFDGTDNTAIDVFKRLKKGYHLLTRNDLADLLICDKKKRKKYECYMRPDQYFTLYGYSVNNDYWDNYLENHLDFLLHMRRKENKDNATNWFKNGIVDVIYGGPGSGKTFLAILLLRLCLERGLNVAYVYKSSASVNSIFGCLRDRALEVFPKNNENCKLQDLIRNTDYDKIPEEYRLFKNRKKDDVCKFDIIAINEYENNKGFDVYIIDEAHRIKDENIEKIINEQNKRRKMVVLFYDEHQVIDDNIELISKIAQKKCCQNRSLVSRYNIFNLWSQFRCGLDDGYLISVEYALGIRNTGRSRSQIDFDVVLENEESVRSLVRKIIRYKQEYWILTVCDDNKDDIESLGNILGMEKEKIHLWGKECDGSKEYNGQMITSYRDEGGISIGRPHTVQGVETDRALVIVKHEFDAIEKDRLQNKYRILLTRALKECHIFCTCPKIRKRFEKEGFQIAK